MKYSSAILASLLLLGVCSGKAYEKPSFADEDGRMPDKWDLDADMQIEPDMAETDSFAKAAYDNAMKNTDKAVRRTKSSRLFDLSDIKNFISQKFSDLVSTINGQEKSNDHEATVYLDQMPPFADPLEIGHVTDKVLLASVNYENVEFYGLSSVYRASFKVDTQAKTAVVCLRFRNEAQVKGEYTISRLLSRSAGKFYVNLTDNVRYEQTFSYEYNDGQMQLGESQGYIRYGGINSQYENIGTFAHLFQEHLGKALLEAIDSRLYEEVNAKMYDQIQTQIKFVNKHFTRARAVSLMQECIDHAIEEIQKSLSQTKNPSIYLTNEKPRYINHGQTYAKIMKVNLLGIQYFNQTYNRVTYADKMIHANFQLELFNATAATSVQYKDEPQGEEKEAQFFYVLSNMHAQFEFEAQPGASGVKLSGVRVHVGKVHLRDHANYDGEMGYLAEHLAPQVQSYVDEAMRKFFQTSFSGMFGQGFFEPSQGYKGPIHYDA